ncbi:uncharacterized protein LOC113667646 [Pocillopora damicornis]|uniref:uncharacterized protein LOC113667646 n=1 Tax=Pocillopora damicornis TaxID=46731 RepID=UPI000F551FC9|nr:uncharacterized protein LOC113667646 [Pocillopora damicornis]
MWITLVTTGEISDSIANEHAPMRKKRVLERDAVTVIKRKPNDLKVKPYVSGLLEQLQLQDGNWNKKVLKQQEKLLECQQEWMSKILPLDMDLVADADIATFREECVSLSKFQTHERYMYMMKNVILQRKSVENPSWSLKEESILLWNTLLGTIEYLTMVIQDREPSLPFPKGMYLACIRKIQAFTCGLY